MALIDSATIYVRSGRGGDGCVSMRREKFVPKGGPDGGDGGDGGDVVLVADPSIDTLLPLTHRPHYRAGHGEQGRGKSMHGANGEDRAVNVPVGTAVYDAESGTLVADLDSPGARAVVAEGGRGGLGNEHFKSATNQTPREATPGEPMVERTLRLELKLIADVGLIGLPNAGKSTFLRAVSRATPKVADYPFTTVEANLGIAMLPGDRRLVVADIPGLIEGAAGGAGLGHEFLRHVERTSVLLHLVDVAPADGSSPAENYFAIRQELAAYDASLAEKPEIVVLNKVDLLAGDDGGDRETADREDMIEQIAGRLGFAKDQRPLVASGATGDGVRAVLEACWSALGKEDTPGWSRGAAREAESQG